MHSDSPENALAIEASLNSTGLEHQLQHLHDIISMAIMIYQQDSYVYVNRAISKITGFSRSELLGMKFWELVHPAEQATVRARGHARLEGKNPQNIYELRILTKAQETRWLHIKAEVITLNEMPAVLISAIDISERKEAEEALTARENQYRSLIENYSAGVTIHAPNTKTIFCNKRAEELLGLSRDKIINHTAIDSDIIYYRENGSVLPLEELPIMRVSAGGKALHNLTVGFSRQGDPEKRWLQMNAFPEFNGAGQISQIICTFADISTQVHSERILKESEHKFRVLTESSPVAIMIHRGDKLVYANRTSQEITGYSNQELLDMDYLNLTHPDQRQLVSQNVAGWLNGSNKTDRFEMKILTKENQTRWLDLKVAQINYKGSPALIGSGMDITDRKLTQARLQKSEERYRMLFEESRDPIFVIDLAGTFSEINPAMLKLFGYEQQELLDLKAQDLCVSTEDQEHLKRALQANGSQRDFPLRLRQKSGRSMECLLNCNLLQDALGEIIGYQGSIRDISEQKQLEVQFLQAQKMEAIGTLASGIAHDFNNLLMSIQGNTSLMLTAIPRNSHIYEKLRNIEHAVKSGANLTRQFLNFARGNIDNGNTPDPNHTIRKTTEMFGRTRKEIAVRTSLQDDCWQIQLDASQLEQILMNLYINAWQAMPQGGTLEISTENVQLSRTEAEARQLKEGRYVRIDVKDSGHGIPDQLKNQIFEPFFTTKAKDIGTGLGLSSSYGIIKSQRGHIDVSSQEGLGTTFTILLPAGQDSRREETGDGEQILHGSGTILLVDDEEMVMNISAEMIRNLGYNVLTASDGQEALRIYSQQHPTIDLVILDMVMPQMGGRETYSQIRKINPNARILLASGYNLEQEGLHFIQKPFSLTALSREIQAALNN